MEELGIFTFAAVVIAAGLFASGTVVGAVWAWNQAYAANSGQTVLWTLVVFFVSVVCSLLSRKN